MRIPASSLPLTACGGADGAASSSNCADAVCTQEEDILCLELQDTCRHLWVPPAAGQCCGRCVLPPPTGCTEWSDGCSSCALRQDGTYHCEQTVQMPHRKFVRHRAKIRGKEIKDWDNDECRIGEAKTAECTAWNCSASEAKCPDNPCEMKICVSGTICQSDASPLTECRHENSAFVCPDIRVRCVLACGGLPCTEQDLSDANAQVERLGGGGSSDMVGIMAARGPVDPNIANIAPLCLGDAPGQPNWWALYKFPPTDTGDPGAALDRGEEYIYLDSNEVVNHQTEAPGIRSPQSALLRTLRQSDNMYYLDFSDQPPNQATFHQAHMKGSLIYGGQGGILVMHSVPRMQWDSYPNSGLTFGQHAACVRLTLTEVFNEWAWLIAMGATFFDTRVQQGTSITPIDPQATRHQELTAGAIHFYTWNNQPFNLYQDVADFFRVNMLAKTWYFSKARVLEPTCNADFQYGLKEYWDSTISPEGDHPPTGRNDHSKWCIPTTAEIPWVCFGDLNHETSQITRGGGALCFTSKSLYVNMIEILLGDCFSPLE